MLEIVRELYDTHRSEERENKHSNLTHVNELY